MNVAQACDRADHENERLNVWQDVAQHTYRSGETSLNSSRFAGLTCERNDAVNTNCPTQLPKLWWQHVSVSGLRNPGSIATHPARKALNGKLVTRTQYRNCTMPESMRNTRKASIVLRRVDVFS